MIEVKNLTKKYGDSKAVDDLSFCVESGQTLALIGTSGSGKTTTLKMINRLIEPSAGEIWVNGEAVSQLPVEQMRRRMGFVIQEAGLFPHYTVAENIGVVPKLLEWQPDRIKNRVEELMQKLGLLPGRFADKMPHQLSGGQQQRVGIARALAADPPIILMDEPFGALDPITRQKIRKEFMELEELASKTTILVTHDVEEAFEMADVVCLLHTGKMQQIGSPTDLLFDPANEFVSQFLEGQQLHLELGTVSLEQLGPFLPKGTSSVDQDTSAHAPKDKLWEVLSRLAVDYGEGHFSWKGSARKFDAAQLIAAFYQFKKEH